MPKPRLWNREEPLFGSVPQGVARLGATAAGPSRGFFRRDTNMVVDWIRMRTDLYRDPKVCLIADHLMCPDSDLSRYVNQNCQRDMAVTRNVMRNVTVGALVTVWGVTRHRGKRVNDVDLLLRGVTLAVVDDIADLPGFGEAMESVGWAAQTDDGVVFPNFIEEFNTDPSVDAKAKNAERQRRHREKRNALRNVTVTSQSNAREEKSREETTKKKTPLPPLPEILQTPEFEAAWRDWVRHRTEIKKPLKPTQAAEQLRQFYEWGQDRAIRAIRFTIAKGWQGIREPEPDANTPAPSIYPQAIPYKRLREAGQ